MSDFPRLPGPNLVRRQGHDGDGFSVQGRELDLVPFAFLMNEHNGADVSPCQSVFGQVTGKNHIFEFLNHERLLLRGWAVINLSIMIENGLVYRPKNA